MNRWSALIILILLLKSAISVAQNVQKTKLWLINVKISYNSTYRRDTTGSFDAGGKQWTKEFHQTGKTNTNGYITAIVENQSENPAKDFLYHSDAGEPVSLTVTGNGSNMETTNGQETIDGKMISADNRTDNVSGAARPGATLYFEYSNESKSFDASMGIKAVGSYQGRIFDGLKWNDYGGDYDDYSISVGGGGDPSTDRNCRITKTSTGYQGNWKESESKKHQTSNGPEYTTSETTVEITVMPYKESDKPVVTIDGCKDLGVGETGTVTGTAKPEGGSFKFWAEPSDMMAVNSTGNTASVTGQTPRKGVIMVEYTTPDGKTAQASTEAACVKIESYNGGQAIPVIGLFDIDGKKKNGILTVPVKAQPADAAELVKFDSADPGVLSAVGVGSEVTLQGLKTGKTTLQAKTKCGENTGPAVEVEVANCDEETIATLERMKKAAMENLVDATNEMQRVAGSPEFEKARDELVSSTRELLAKAALTIIANGKSPTTVIKVAAEIADKGAALSEVIASSNPEEMKDNIGKTAAGDSFEKIVEKKFGEAVRDFWGKSLSAVFAIDEVQKAAQKFGENMGEILKHDEVMKSLMDNYEKAMRDLDRFTKRLNVCKGNSEQPKSKEQPKSDQTPKPKDPVQPQEPAKPKDPAPKTETPTNPEPPVTEPPADDEIFVDPEPPTVPPKQVGLPYEPTDCGCNKSKDLTLKSADFSSLGSGLKNLGNCVENFRSTSLTDYQGALQEISTLSDSLSTKLKTNAGAFLIMAKESKPRLDKLVLRVKSYDKAGTEFLNTMEKCPESVTSGMEIFKSVETINVDSIKTHY